MYFHLSSANIHLLAQTESVIHLMNGPHHQGFLIGVCCDTMSPRAKDGNSQETEMNLPLYRPVDFFLPLLSNGTHLSFFSRCYLYSTFHAPFETMEGWRLVTKAEMQVAVLKATNVQNMPTPPPPTSLILLKK